MNLTKEDIRVIIAAMDYAYNDLFGGPEGEEVGRVLEKVKEIESRKDKFKRIHL